MDQTEEGQPTQLPLVLILSANTIYCQRCSRNLIDKYNSTINHDVIGDFVSIRGAIELDTDADYDAKIFRYRPNKIEPILSDTHSPQQRQEIQDASPLGRYCRVYVQTTAQSPPLFIWSQLDGYHKLRMNDLSDNSSVTWLEDTNFNTTTSRYSAYDVIESVVDFNQVVNLILAIPICTWDRFIRHKQGKHANKRTATAIESIQLCGKIGVNMLTTYTYPSLSLTIDVLLTVVVMTDTDPIFSRPSDDIRHSLSITLDVVRKLV